MSQPHCRLLPQESAEGAWNMAADEVMLEGAMSGQASLRFYAWSTATVSLGYFQSAKLCRAHGKLAALPWVRRASGGATLVHDAELTYALALPPGPPWQIRGDSSWTARMHGLIQGTLLPMGVPCQTVVPNAERKLGEVLCFLHHTPGDLLLKGHKIVGSAQRKRQGAILQHGSILLTQSLHTPELPGISELTGTTLPPWELASALGSALLQQQRWSGFIKPWTDEECSRIDTLVSERYANEGWNERR